MSSLSAAKVIGILGGGQLGRMLAVAAAKLGYRTHVYCPDERSPAQYVSHEFVCADYLDLDCLRDFVAGVDIVTYEFENIPLEALDVVRELKPLYPDTNVLKISQDRLYEKNYINDLSIMTAPYAEVSDEAQLIQAIEKIGYPAVLKTRRDGYDGKGQIKITSEEDIAGALSVLGHKPCILEGFISFEGEASVIVARNEEGEVSVFPLQENVHKNHILDLTIVPARFDQATLERGEHIARSIAVSLDYIGVLTVELFVTKEGALIVNEIAPRVHNSGHWSIEGASVSQFEQHIRAICALPLPPVWCYGQALMKNLIGDDMLKFNELLSREGICAHHYGKVEMRAGRKMGHVTKVFGEDMPFDIHYFDDV